MTTKSFFLAAVAMLAVLIMALTCQAATAAKIITSPGTNLLPSGVQLRSEISVLDFLSLEYERNCVRLKNRNRGFHFVPVKDGEAGVALNRCEIGAALAGSVPLRSLTS
jgi:hypothetical protein